MKVFATHLPAMTRTELIVLMGQAQRALGEAGWQVAQANPPGFAVAGASPAGGVRGEILPGPAGDSELRITFSEATGVTPDSEGVVGVTMNMIHRTLVRLLGQPPVPNIWMMTAGRWTYGVQFNS